jgi:hypothetical protein
MTTQSFNSAPAGFGMQETCLCFALVAALSAMSWGLFSQMPAYGAQPTTHAVTVAPVAAPTPMCFNHTREQVIAQEAQTMADIAAGCPRDPMAYRQATLRQVNG